MRSLAMLLLTIAAGCASTHAPESEPPDQARHEHTWRVIRNAWPPPPVPDFMLTMVPRVRWEGTSLAAALRELAKNTDLSITLDADASRALADRRVSLSATDATLDTVIGLTILQVGQDGRVYYTADDHRIVIRRAPE